MGRKGKETNRGRGAPASAAAKAQFRDAHDAAVLAATHRVGAVVHSLANALAADGIVSPTETMVAMLLRNASDEKESTPRTSSTSELLAPHEGENQMTQTPTSVGLARSTTEQAVRLEAVHTVLTGSGAVQLSTDIIDKLISACLDVCVALDETSDHVDAYLDSKHTAQSMSALLQLITMTQRGTEGDSWSTAVGVAIRCLSLLEKRDDWSNVAHLSGVAFELVHQVLVHVPQHDRAKLNDLLSSTVRMSLIHGVEETLPKGLAAVLKVMLHENSAEVAPWLMNTVTKMSDDGKRGLRRSLVLLAQCFGDDRSYTIGGCTIDFSLLLPVLHRGLVDDSDPLSMKMSLAVLGAARDSGVSGGTGLPGPIEFWSHLLIVFEFLTEVHLHLLSPAIPHIEAMILQAGTTPTLWSWVESVFHRLIGHAHPSVSQLGVKMVLAIDISKWHTESIAQLCSFVLSTLVRELHLAWVFQLPSTSEYGDFPPVATNAVEFFKTLSSLSDAMAPEFNFVLLLCQTLMLAQHSEPLGSFLFLKILTEAEKWCAEVVTCVSFLLDNIAASGSPEIHAAAQTLCISFLCTCGPPVLDINPASAMNLGLRLLATLSPIALSSMGAPLTEWAEAVVKSGGTNGINGWIRTHLQEDTKSVESCSAAIAQLLRFASGCTEFTLRSLSFFEATVGRMSHAAHMSPTVQDRTFQLFVHLCMGADKTEQQLVLRENVLKIVSPHMDCFASSVARRLYSLANIESSMMEDVGDVFRLYLRALSCCLNASDEDTALMIAKPAITRALERLLSSQAQDEPLTSSLAAMHIFAACVANVSVLERLVSQSQIDGKTVVSLTEIALPAKGSFPGNKALWARLVSRFEELRWRSIGEILRCRDTQTLLNPEDAKSLCSKCIRALGYNAGSALLPQLKTLKFLLPCDDLDLRFKANLICWQVLEENMPRSRKEFTALVDAACDVVFCQSNMDAAAENSDVRADLLTRFGDLLSKSAKRDGVVTYALRYILERLPKAGGEWSLGHIVDCAILGHFDARDSKASSACAAYCMKLLKRTSPLLHETNLRSDAGSNSHARKVAIQFLCSRQDDVALSPSTTIRELLNRNNTIDEAVGGRYHQNSTAHRCKVRIWQLIVMLAQTAPDTDREVVLLKVLKALRQDNVSTIRTLIEWAAFLLARDDVILNQFFLTPLKAWDEAPTLIVSLMSVLNWQCRTSSSGAAPTEILEIALAWIGSHHNTVRAHAHGLIQSAATAVVARGLPLPPAIAQVVNFAAHTAATAKSPHPSTSGFFWATFDPQREWCCEFILSVCPQLMGLDSSEGLSLPEVTALHCIGFLCPVDWCPDEDVRIRVDEQRRGSTTLRDQLDPNPPPLHLLQDIQRKPLPTDNPSDQVTEGRGASTSLIVIASLLDKPANLGGLARTCEVMGASALVVGNHKWVTDKEFVSVSASAAKWVPMYVVAPTELTEYLDTLKEQNYTIVGAEQTINSVPFQKCAFDRRTAIVLGAERTGIPASLIPALDMCVEIPQVGQTRSLNVHVSGALFVWEFVRQNLST